MRQHIQHVSREPESVPKLAQSITGEGPYLRKVITYEHLERILGVEIEDYEKFVLYT